MSVCKGDRPITKLNGILGCSRGLEAAADRTGKLGRWGGCGDLLSGDSYLVGGWMHPRCLAFRKLVICGLFISFLHFYPLNSSTDLYKWRTFIQITSIFLSHHRSLKTGYSRYQLVFIDCGGWCHAKHFGKENFGKIENKKIKAEKSKGNIRKLRLKIYTQSKWHFVSSLRIISEPV